MVIHLGPRYDLSPQWEPTGDYRMDNGVLMRRWTKLEWPHEPYREKGEEIVHEEWRPT